MMHRHFRKLSESAVSEANKQKETPKEEKATGAMESFPQKRRGRPSKGE